MNVRRWISAFSVLLGLVCVGMAGHGQTIEWKAFNSEGKPFYQVVDTDTKQDMKVMDMAFQQKQRQTFLIEWTPKGKKGDKIVIEEKIVGVKMDLDIGGNKIDYDSTKENAKNPMTQFFKALRDAKFTLTIDPKTHKVEKVEGLDDLVKELSKVNKAFEPVLKQILSEKTIKTLAEPVFGMLPPDGKIPEKGTWKGDEVKLPMGPLGTYTTTNEYTAEKPGTDAKDKNVVKINVKSDLKYQAPTADDVKNNKGGLPFVIKPDSKLESKKSTGTIEFNTEKGRIEKSKMTTELGGTLDVSIGATDTKVALTQTQEVTVQTYDENPWMTAPKK